MGVAPCCNALKEASEKTTIQAQAQPASAPFNGVEAQPALAAQPTGSPPAPVLGAAPPQAFPVTAPANGATMAVRFLIPGTQDLKDVMFAKRPLGIDFNKKMPISVKQVSAGGAGAAAGVQNGWVLVAINSADLATCTFEEAVQLLKDGAQKLPHDKSASKKSKGVKGRSDEAEAGQKLGDLATIDELT